MREVVVVVFAPPFCVTYLGATAVRPPDAGPPREVAVVVAGVLVGSLRQLLVRSRCVSVPLDEHAAVQLV